MNFSGTPRIARCEALAAGTNVCFDVTAFNGNGSSSAAHACVTTAAVTEKTVVIGLNKTISGQAVYYLGSSPSSGTLRKLHVEFSLR